EPDEETGYPQKSEECLAGCAPGGIIPRGRRHERPRENLRIHSGVRRMKALHSLRTVSHFGDTSASVGESLRSGMHRTVRARLLQVVLERARLESETIRLPEPALRDPQQRRTPPAPISVRAQPGRPLSER